MELIQALFDMIDARERNRETLGETTRRAQENEADFEFACHTFMDRLDRYIDERDNK